MGKAMNRLQQAAYAAPWSDASPETPPPTERRAGRIIVGLSLNK
jgi:hypothetical protein